MTIGSIINEIFETDKTVQRKCPNCGNKLTAENKFCTACGIEIVFRPVCPLCHEEKAEADVFCDVCGSLLNR